MSFWDWSSSASGNATSSGVNIGENCPAGNMNNWGRTIMAQIRAVFSQALAPFLGASTLADARTALGVQEANARLAALSGLSGGANTLPYSTGVNSMGQTPLTAFARSLLDDGDASTARTTLGVAEITFASNSNGSVISINIGGTVYKLQWGTFTASARAQTSRTFPSAYSGTPVVIAGGASSLDTGAENNFPEVYSASTTGFVVISSRNEPTTTRWIAIGV